MKDIELIKKFLDGELSHKERLILLKRIEKDAVFTNKLFEIIKESTNLDISDSFSHLSKDQLKDSTIKKAFIEDIIQKFGGAPATDDELEFANAVKKAISDQSSKKRFNIFLSGKFKYWAAASLILFILFPISYFSTRNIFDPDTLYQKYFVPVSPITFRDGINHDSVYCIGVTQLNNGNYLEAINTFNLIPEDHNSILLVKLYTGNAYMAIENYRKALEILTPLLEQDCLFTDEVAWYIALCELKLGQFEEASKHLDQVTNSYPKSNYPIDLNRTLKRKIQKLTN